MGNKSNKSAEEIKKSLDDSSTDKNPNSEGFAASEKNRKKQMEENEAAKKTKKQ